MSSDRRWLLPGLIGLAAGAALAIGAVTLLAGGDGSDDVEAADALVDLVTVEVEQRDLVAFSTIDATIGFERTVDIPITRDGTVTWVAEAGTVVDAGDVVVEVDENPVVVLRGSTPVWRDLGDDVDPGPDVRQLEENLVALGFTADGELVVDDQFDDATETAVEAWQEALGLEADGIVEAEDVVLLPGRSELGDPSVVVGNEAQTGTTLVTATVLSLDQLIVQRASGELYGVVTAVAPDGTAVVDGTALYEIDGRPVVAVVENESAPAVTFDRDITDGVDPGDDIRLLEDFLARQGFDAGGALAVDRELDLATLVAIAEWQTSIGVVPEDVPVVRRGDLVVVRGSRSVGESLVAVGEVGFADAPAMTLTRAVRVVTGELPVADLDLLEVGQDVEIELPDGALLEGVVREVGDVARAGAGQDADAVVDFVVEVIDGEVTSTLVVAPVTVRVLDDAVLGAISVPVPSLVALSEGGYAVEIIEGAASRLVLVELGAYADSWVEVTNEAVAPGELVVVAQ